MTATTAKARTRVIVCTQREFPQRDTVRLPRTDDASFVFCSQNLHSARSPLPAQYRINIAVGAPNVYEPDDRPDNSFTAQYPVRKWKTCQILVVVLIKCTRSTLTMFRRLKPLKACRKLIHLLHNASYSVSDIALNCFSIIYLLPLLTTSNVRFENNLFIIVKNVRIYTSATVQYIFKFFFCCYLKLNGFFALFVFHLLYRE